MSLTSRQKTKTATNLTINYLIIPLLAATGIYFLIDNIKLPDVISKNLWIVAVAVIGSVAIGLSTNYLKAKQVKQTDTQKELPKEQQVSPPSTPAKQLEKNDSLVNN
jgi:fructose-specific phosphotransferase system IIC component